MCKILIGIGIPYIGVIGLLPGGASIDRFVLGIPFIEVWICGWFILTSGCLLTGRRLFDCNVADAAARVR